MELLQQITIRCVCVCGVCSKHTYIYTDYGEYDLNNVILKMTSYGCAVYFFKYYFQSSTDGMPTEGPFESISTSIHSRDRQFFFYYLIWRNPRSRSGTGGPTTNRIVKQRRQQYRKHLFSYPPDLFV